MRRSIFKALCGGEMFKPASYQENQEGLMLPAALIGIHFHFPMVLNVKNRAHAKCFEFAPGRPQSPGRKGWKHIGLLWKGRRTVTILPFEKKKAKDDILLLTSSMVRWEHSVKSCQRLSSFDRNKSSGRTRCPPPPSPSSCLCGFPLGAPQYTLMLRRYTS